MTADHLPNFELRTSGNVGRAFLNLGVTTFHEACRFIQHLPYRRPVDQTTLIAILHEHCGTCSSKHAVLKLLADEHGIEKIKLYIGVFKMDGVNTPKIKERLHENGLAYLPEAHTYLRYMDKIFDFTDPKSSPQDFENDLLVEREIQPGEIYVDKVKFHQEFLSSWLVMNPDMVYTLEEIWTIREGCIADLSK
ncbi:hypothetical protein [Sphingobacterium lactis]|uniref:hypothetical protein n=1 Tax=Sphingobacterium lactis TaxID=797291 RepID=UPI003DA2C933